MAKKKQLGDDDDDIIYIGLVESRQTTNQMNDDDYDENG